MHIFDFKKNETKKKRQKAKEAIEANTISVENQTGYDGIVCDFAQCTFNFLYRVVNISWLFI